MRTNLFALVALAVLLGATSCTTYYYSSSIAGHDSIDLPIPTDVEGRAFGVGFDARTTPTGSLFTDDRTNSTMGTVFFRARFFKGNEQRAYLRASISEYYAINSLAISDGKGGTLTKGYAGFGTAAGLRPSMVFDYRGSAYEVAFNVLIDQEYGDFRQFRQAVSGAKEGKRTQVDLSPNGRTAAALWEAAFELKTNLKLTLTSGIGVTYFDFPSSGGVNGIAKLGLILQRENYWASLGYQWMPPLNGGLSLGIGLSVY